MCLYPKLIDNPKYKATKKNGGIIPSVTDERVMKVPIGCGKCIECRKKKAREWQVRLLEDIKENTNGKFITLTFSNEAIKFLTNKINKEQWAEGYMLDNEIATRAVRYFTERWRKKYKKTLRHWLVTELGHNGTENIHLHGIVWTNDVNEIERIWNNGLDENKKPIPYGHVWKGKRLYTTTGQEYLENYVNARTIGYIVKYVSKIDKLHKEYQSIILTSNGIGNRYTKIQNGNWTKNKYNEKNTNETYKTTTGHKITLPIYMRNKIYTEEEREKLWIQKLDKQERWINGQRIDISKGEEEYNRALKYAQQENKELGYGNDEKNWEQKEYEHQRRILKQKQRIYKTKASPAGVFRE